MKRLLAFAVLLFTIMPAAHAEEALELGCNPAKDSEVAPGESITYILNVLQGGEKDDWANLTIRLGEGMVLDEFEFFGFNEQIEEGKQEYVAREIITGNDGCVILTSWLQSGDYATFTAHAGREDAVLTATAQVGDHSVSVAHKLVKLPIPAPPILGQTPSVSLVPILSSEAQSNVNASFAIVITIIFGVIGALACFCYACRNDAWMQYVFYKAKEKLEALKSKNNIGS